MRFKALALSVWLSHPLQRLRLTMLRFSGKPVRFSVGDSHAAFTFMHIPRVIRLGFGPVTMHRIGRDGLKGFLLFSAKSMLWPRSVVRPGDDIFFSFGEIDCRCHVALQVALGRSEDEVIETLATAYIDALQEERTAGVRFWIVSVTPPADASRLKHFKSFIPTGSDEQRARITRLLNETIRALAAERGFSYLDVYSAYADKEGMLPIDSSDGLTHIGDTSAVARLLAGWTGSL